MLEMFETEFMQRAWLAGLIVAAWDISPSPV